MQWPQILRELFSDEKQLATHKLLLDNHELRLKKVEKFMTTFGDDVTQLEALVPAVIGRSQKDEKDLAAANELLAERTTERDTAIANAADPDTVHRLEVQIAALQQFLAPPAATTTDTTSGDATSGS